MVPVPPISSRYQPCGTARAKVPMASHSRPSAAYAFAALKKRGRTMPTPLQRQRAGEYASAAARIFACPSRARLSGAITDPIAGQLIGIARDDCSGLFRSARAALASFPPPVLLWADRACTSRIGGQLGNRAIGSVGGISNTVAIPRVG